MERPDCGNLCRTLKRHRYPNAELKSVINVHPYRLIWEGCFAFSVEHKKGNYKYHYILEENGKIIDPFLFEEGLIPKEDYLQKYYKNPQHLKIV
jgi:hypothetical protein